MIKEFLRNKALRKSEKKWKLSDERITDFDSVYLFPFIDFIDTCGHFEARVKLSKLRIVVFIPLNNKQSEEAILHTLKHEDIHMAMTFALRNQLDFVETVIDKWILNGQLINDGNKTIVKDYQKSN